MSDIRECPHCSGTGFAHWHRDHKEWYVVCSSCAATGPPVSGLFGRQACINLWNSRKHEHHAALESLLRLCERELDLDDNNYPEVDQARRVLGHERAAEIHKESDA